MADDENRRDFQDIILNQTGMEPQKNGQREETTVSNPTSLLQSQVSAALGSKDSSSEFSSICNETLLWLPLAVTVASAVDVGNFVSLVLITIIVILVRVKFGDLGACDHSSL